MNSVDMARDYSYQAQSERMQLLLTAWDKEIQEAQAALRKEAQAIEVQKEAEAAQARKQAAEEAADRALTNAVSSYLSGLATQASANDASAVTVPSGVRVASGLFAGPPMVELNALLSAVDGEIAEGRADAPTDAAQKSAVWALEHGLMPHPGDISQLITASGVDAAWAGHFQGLATGLESLEAKSFRNPQLQGVLAHERITMLHDHVAALHSYGSERLLGLVAQPGQLGKQLGEIKMAPPSSAQAATGARMPEREFNKMLDRLFGA